MERGIKFCHICLVLLLFVGYIGAPPNTCKIPNGDAGKCTPLKKCTPLYNVNKNKHRTSKENSFLKQSAAVCGRGRRIKVCCPPREQWSTYVMEPVIYPETPKFYDANVIDNTDEYVSINSHVRTYNNVLTNQTRSFEGDPQSPHINYEACGIQQSSTRIVGGAATDIDEFPWLALLEYEPKRFRCGGSLITNRFVLTAAHCLIGTHGPPQKVRLSEYNTTSEPTDYIATDGGGVETIAVTVVPVARVAWHPDPFTNDIGLVKMADTVQFSCKPGACYLIRTICLPTRDHTSEFTNATSFVIAGWGSDSEVDNTEVKMAVSVPFVPAEVCRDHAANFHDEKYICAGGEEGKDSCSGDSGGPLMYDPNVEYIVVGIVSSGSPSCGTKGVPGVYTNVYRYLNWINSTIEASVDEDVELMEEDNEVK